MVSDAQTVAQEEPKSSSPLGVRDFRLLWIGESVSVLGDQFYMIALPWLVLKLTGDAFALGTVLALGGIPRALFMLVGGAITDRFSPRAVMFVSNLARLLLVALLAALVLTGSIQLWMLYGLALAFGLADAFFFPASSAIVPQILTGEQLQAGNAIVQGTAQLSVFVGPFLAGLLIALIGRSPETAVAAEGAAQAVPETTGIGLAFAIDALTFLASLAALALMTTRRPATAEAGAGGAAGVWAAIKAGLTYAWNDLTLRTLVIAIAAINFFFVGPFVVGVPVLADTRLPEGAAAFGILMALFGGGSLLGIVMAGVLPKPPSRWMGSLLFALVAFQGLALAGVGFVESTAVAALAVLLMSTAGGYVNILGVTWLQRRTSPDMLGRTMSLIMFASIGLSTVSQAIAGGLLGLNLTAVFVGAGLALAAVGVWSASLPALRAMELEPVPTEPRTVADALRSTGEMPILGLRSTQEEMKAIHRTQEMRALDNP